MKSKPTVKSASRFGTDRRRRYSWPGHFAKVGLCFVWVALLGSVGCGAAESVRWTGATAGREYGMDVFEPAGLPAGNTSPLPVAFYLKNLPAPRLGTVPDEVLIGDLRANGLLVVVIDFANDPQARVPWINRDLGKLRDDVRAKKLLGGRAIDAAHVYIVPAGSRLVRDVVFYRDGARALAMDIIAPANPKTPVGAVLEFSCDNQNRMGNASLSICSDTILDGAATEGFAVAMADHPVAAPYKGLDAMPDCAWKIKAAVRTLRAQSAKLGLNGRIVPVGFSRGSGMALMLVTTEGISDFEGRGAHSAVKLSSTVQGAVVMSGRFTYLDLLTTDPMLPRYAKAWGERETALDAWRRHGALDYLTKPTVPLFLTINVTESPEALHQMEVLRKRLAALGSPATYELDRDPRGHKVTLDPAILASMQAYLRQQLTENPAAPSR